MAISATLPRQASCFRASCVGDGKPPQLPGHEIHDVVGVALGADAIDVPSPGGRDGVEREQPLLGQRGEELDREERIAAGLLVHQLRQRLRALRLAMQGIGDEPADIVESESGASTISCTRASASRIASSVRMQRVRRADLVVPVGADQQQVPHLRVRDQMLEEVERRGIQPLQIVEEQRERMLLPANTPRKRRNTIWKRFLRVLRRQVRRPAAACRSRAPARERG